MRHHGHRCVLLNLRVPSAPLNWITLAYEQKCLCHILTNLSENINNATLGKHHKYLCTWSTQCDKRSWNKSDPSGPTNYLSELREDPTYAQGNKGSWKECARNFIRVICEDPTYSRFTVSDCLVSWSFILLVPFRLYFTDTNSHTKTMKNNLGIYVSSLMLSLGY